MCDIKKFVTPVQDAGDAQADTARVAEAAAREGLTLSPEHWEVIRYLRSFHRQHEGAFALRDLSEGLDAKFGARGGRRYLYRLFPGGPITQGCRIAGLPVPDRSTDPSFGSSF